jgi:hypothetical protein
MNIRIISHHFSADLIIKQCEPQRTATELKEQTSM